MYTNTYDKILGLCKRYNPDNDPTLAVLQQTVEKAVASTDRSTSITSQDLVGCFQHIKLPNTPIPAWIRETLETGEIPPDTRIAIKTGDDVRAMFDDKQPYLFYGGDVGIGTFYKVKDHDLQTLTITPLLEQQVEIALRSELMATLRRSGLEYVQQPAREIKGAVGSYLNYEIYGRPLDKPPAIVSLGQEEGWCLHRCLLEPDPEMPTPYWDDFLERLTSPEIFCAWVWGVLTGEYAGRALAYIHGPRGGEGKSIATRVLSKTLFGDTSYAVNNTSLKNQYNPATFQNKALLTYLDCNNRTVVKSELVRSITSFGEELPIEEKYKTPTTAVLFVRMLVCSNWIPLLEDMEADLDRMLYFQIRHHGAKNKHNPRDWEANLTAELPGLLFYAKTCWDRLNKNGDLQPDKTMSGLLGGVVQQNPFEEYLANFLTITGDEDDTIRRDFINQNFMDHYPTERAEDFFAFLKNKQGVGYKRIKHGMAFTGIVWKKEEDDDGISIHPKLHI